MTAKRVLGAVVVAMLVASTGAAGLAVIAAVRLTAPPRPVAEEVDASGRTPAEARAVFAAAVAGSMRPAIDADGEDTEARRELESLYAGYHPFFSRGDLNGDGRLDFVQGFLRKGRTPWFDVAVFFGEPDGTFSEPLYVERAVSRTFGDLAIERSLLVVTPDLAADRARRWRYEPVERVFVDADATPSAEAPSPEDPEESPDDRPRARA